MLHETRITETHSAAAIISNVPRWGLGTELEWRRRHPNQHARSAWQLRRPTTAAAAASRSRSEGPPSSGGDGGGGAEECAPEDYFARLSTDGAHRLDGEQLRQRQKAQIFGVVRRAMAEKRQLFGTTVGDTQTFFETADADSIIDDVESIDLSDTDEEVEDTSPTSITDRPNPAPPSLYTPPGGPARPSLLHSFAESEALTFAFHLLVFE